MTLSIAGLIGIASWEQYRGEAYRPTPHDVPTIGYGATHGVKMGDRTDPLRALVRLANDTDKVATAVQKCLGDVPLTQAEFDVYVSLAYNVGPTAFCGSTLVRLLHRQPPDYAGACAQVLRWNRQNGRVLPGLAKRREAEYRQCMGVQP